MPMERKAKFVNRFSKSSEKSDNNFGKDESDS